MKKKDFHLNKDELGTLAKVFLLDEEDSQKKRVEEKKILITSFEK